ncbi:MAG: 2-C-methyl-D-erythritol 4-phosphate cytidylyltransferase [Eubacteriales bacterium]|nr:2-C-methyl-D-erythritol 4-phosphate cytidylyltransferase [Eubacteriales bacterium]
MSKIQITVIIVAAGDSTRMGGINKQLFEIDGKPVIAHTIAAFEKADKISSIIIVIKKETIPQLQTLCRDYGFSKVTYIIEGGKERCDSVMRGISHAKDADYIAIHDGARACITPKQIDLLCHGAIIRGAVVPGCIVTDTVKRIVDGKIVENIQRAGLFTVQTPQIFKADILKDAYSRFTGENVTDDSSVVANAGYDVYIIEMPDTNIKITTPDDLQKAERIIKSTR